MQLPKSIKAIIKDDGSVQIDFDGFEGATCFKEAEQLYNFLKNVGVDVKISNIVPKTSVSEKVKVDV